MQSVVLEGAFYRYQAPLISFGLFSIFLVLFKYSSGKIEDLKRLILEPKFILVIIFAVSFLSTVLFLGNKMPLLIFKITQASTNIYGQQYQMGLFLKQFYQGKAIAATDIGAISYLADIKSLDLYGLGSIEVAKNKINNTFSRERAAQLVETNDVKIAILYDRYFKDRLSASWVKAGKWEIDNNIISGDDTSFYATESEEKNDLLKNLKTFSPQLPSNVSSTIYNQ